MLEIYIYICLQSQTYLFMLRVYPPIHTSVFLSTGGLARHLLVRRQPELALLRRAVRAPEQPVGDRERDDVAQRRDHVRVVVREHLRAALPRRRRRMWDWASPRRCNRRPPRGDAAVHVATTYNGGASPPNGRSARRRYRYAVPLTADGTGPYESTRTAPQRCVADEQRGGSGC